MDRPAVQHLLTPYSTSCTLLSSGQKFLMVPKTRINNQAVAPNLWNSWNNAYKHKGVVCQHL